MPVKNVTLTAAFANPADDPEELEKLTIQIAADLREAPGIEKVTRSADERTPKGSKGLGAFTAGAIKTVVSVSAIKSTLKLLWQKLAGRNIEVTVQVGKKKIVAKVNNEKELRAVFKLANKFASEG